MKKNKKGQIGVGTIVLLAITLIVGAIFLLTIAQEVGKATETETINSSQTLALNGASIYLTDYRLLSGVTLLEAANQSRTLPATNYTVTNNVIDPTTSGLSVQIATNDGAENSTAVLVQATAQKVTYIAEAGGRAMASLIVIMFALAVAVVAIGPTVSKKFLESMGG